MRNISHDGLIADFIKLLKDDIGLIEIDINTPLAEGELQYQRISEVAFLFTSEALELFRLETKWRSFPISTSSNNENEIIWIGKLES